MNSQRMAGRPDPDYRLQPAGEGKSRRCFLTDIQALRRRVRECIEESATAPNPGTLAATALTLLNCLLATLRACAARDRHVHCGDDADRDVDLTERFAVHSSEAKRHADQIAARIIQLGGKPDLASGGPAPGATGTAPGGALIDFIKESMLTQCIAMDSCRDIIDYLDDRDPVTRRLLEGILSVEKKHAKALADLLEGLPL